MNKYQKIAYKLSKLNIEDNPTKNQYYNTFKKINANIKWAYEYYHSLIETIKKNNSKNKNCNFHICGTFTHGQKKPCKHCENFLLWGTSLGRCMKDNEDHFCSEHCKYFKRIKWAYTKDGKNKVEEWKIHF